MPDKTALIKPTIEGWLFYISGALTQYDKRQSTRRGYNPNAMGLYFQALQDGVEAKLTGVMKSEAPEDLEKLKALLKRAFIPGHMPPVDKAIKHIDKFLATGETPAYGRAATRLTAAIKAFQERVVSEAMNERVAARFQVDE